MGEKGRKEAWEKREEKRKGMKGRVREMRERDEERQATAQSRICRIFPGAGGVRVGWWLSLTPPPQQASWDPRGMMILETSVS